MDLSEAMKARHSVRSYSDKKIEGEVLDTLQKSVAECNLESGLHIQLCIDEPTAFDSTMARYGRFSNVNNYIALVGKKGSGFEEKCGYYGEKIILLAQQLGLSSCWVAMTFSKGKSKKALTINPGEKLLMVISLGYGETGGAVRKTKPISELSQVTGDMPDWFLHGMEAVQLAPTAMNQQKFLFALEGDKVRATAGSGFYTRVDLGIAKYHFETGAGSSGWSWAE